MQDWACPGHWNTAQAQGREEQHWALNRTWNLSLRFALTPSLRSDSSGRLLQHRPHCWLQVCRLCPGFCLAVDLNLVKGYKPKLEGNFFLKSQFSWTQYMFLVLLPHPIFSAGLENLPWTLSTCQELDPSFLLRQGIARSWEIPWQVEWGKLRQDS